MPENKSVRAYKALRDAISDVAAGKGSEGVLFGSLEYEDGMGGPVPGVAYPVTDQYLNRK